MRNAGWCGGWLATPSSLVAFRTCTPPRCCTHGDAMWQTAECQESIASAGGVSRNAQTISAGRTIMMGALGAGVAVLTDRIANLRAQFGESGEILQITKRERRKQRERQIERRLGMTHDRGANRGQRR